MSHNRIYSYSRMQSIYTEKLTITSHRMFSFDRQYISEIYLHQSCSRGVPAPGRGHTGKRCLHDSVQKSPPGHFLAISCGRKGQGVWLPSKLAYPHSLLQFVIFQSLENQRGEEASAITKAKYRVNSEQLLRMNDWAFGSAWCPGDSVHLGQMGHLK